MTAAPVAPPSSLLQFPFSSSSSSSLKFPSSLLCEPSLGQTLGCVQVDQSSVAFKEVFGKFDDVLQPGCHCVPWCIDSRISGSLSLRVKQFDVFCETKTKDNVFVTVVASIRYRSLIRLWMLTTSSVIPRHSFKPMFLMLSGQVFRRWMELDSAFEQKNEIAKAVEE